MMHNERNITDHITVAFGGDINHGNAYTLSIWLLGFT